MKRLLFMLLLVSFTVGASAQWKVARLKQDFKYVNYNTPDFIQRGEFVGYTENRNGTITIYCNGGEGTIDTVGTYSSNVKNKYLEFTGYYFAWVRDPVDDYVNVRKGPGTNYPVVGKIRANRVTETAILFKKTESNWLELYLHWQEKDDGGYYFDLGTGFLPFFEEPVMIGYIYKDRVKSPIAD